MYMFLFLLSIVLFFLLSNKCRYIFNLFNCLTFLIAINWGGYSARLKWLPLLLNDWFFCFYRLFYWLTVTLNRVTLIHVLPSFICWYFFIYTLFIFYNRKTKWRLFWILVNHLRF